MFGDDVREHDCGNFQINQKVDGDQMGEKSEIPECRNGYKCSYRKKCDYFHTKGHYELWEREKKEKNEKSSMNSSKTRSSREVFTDDNVQVTLCNRGKDCSFLKKGKCNYFHPPEHSQQMFQPMVHHTIPISQPAMIPQCHNCHHNHPYVPNCPLMEITRMCEHYNTICTFNHTGVPNCAYMDNCVNHKLGQKNNSSEYDKHNALCNDMLS